ncbi:hypothetical protein CK203_026489 [Vitis vinifera]|uniref:Uncharacterized protein n=1 Tax=Vitis vinifera TaxID=29760 RepID=A0A438IVI4_VITVI|nr:hypothetical protein CK203_026489 [Vitis vinifera]
MSANKEATSSSSSGDAHAEKSVDKLNVKEFRERFCIPMAEQFNAGLRFPLPLLFKEFLHFTQIPPAYIHPNMVRVLMGCSILSILFNLDLRYWRGPPEDTCWSRAMGGLVMHPDRQFAPNHSLKVPGKDRREAGRMGGESLVHRLNSFLRLRRPSGVVKRFSPHRISAWLPRSPSRTRPARKVRLNEWERKGKKAFCERLLVVNALRPLHLLAPTKKKKKNNNKRAGPPRLALYFKRLRSLAGLNHSGPLVPVAGRLALLAEKDFSKSARLSLSDADAAGASCAEALPPSAPPTEKRG